MKKFLLTLIVISLSLPLGVLAKESSPVINYSKIMGERLTFGLNRNAEAYNDLVKKSLDLSSEGENLEEVNQKLAETKIIIDRGQLHIAELPNRAASGTATSTPREAYFIVRNLVSEIIDDIRLSYVKIKEIKLLIKQISQDETI